MLHDNTPARVAGPFGWLHGRRSRALGRAEARAEQTGKALEDVEKANRARHRLRRDGNYARRLRERFTRR